MSLAAEREGFEPPVRKAYNGFRDRPDRPLRHLSFQKGLSAFASAKLHLFPRLAKFFSHFSAIFIYQSCDRHPKKQPDRVLLKENQRWFSVIRGNVCKFAM